MRIDILSLFPALFDSFLETSIPGRAARAGHADYHLHDIRDHATGPHRKVDDRPFGGGPGMVMMCQPLFDCVQAVLGAGGTPGGPTPRLVLMSPQGDVLRQPLVEILAREEWLVVMAGHYEGVDERVIDELAPLEVSVGDYVLSGGELPAMVLVDSVVRLLPGVLGHEDSAAEDSFAARDLEGKGRQRLLDCPHYTRPRVWKDRAVPEVLLGGDHAAVDAWRREQMIERTRQRRPDLLDEDRDP